MSQGQLGALRLHPLTAIMGWLPGMCHGDPSVQSCAVTHGPHRDSAVRGAEGGAEVILWVTAPWPGAQPQSQVTQHPGLPAGSLPPTAGLFPSAPSKPQWATECPVFELCKVFFCGRGTRTSLLKGPPAVPAGTRSKGLEPSLASGSNPPFSVGLCKAEQQAACSDSQGLQWLCHLGRTKLFSAPGQYCHSPAMPPS